MQSANQNKNNNSQIAVIAGTGALPELLIEALNQQQKAPFVICFSSDINPKLQPDLVVNLAKVGAVCRAMQQQKIDKVIFAGGIKRPKILSLRPDFVGLRLLASVLKTNLFYKLPGDNTLFSFVGQYLAGLGIEMVGAHQIVPELLAEEVCYTQKTPTPAQEQNIDFAIAEAKKLGSADVGQAVIVANGAVAATEDWRGTDAMLAEAAGKFAPSDNAVLVKCKKPQQDERIDLPTIGVETVRKAHAAGLCGVMVEARHSIVLDKPAVAKLADELGLFVCGK